jgi:hypothetical protein
LLLLLAFVPLYYSVGVALPPSGGITLRLIESVTRTDRTSIQSPLQPRIYIGTISTYIHSVPKCQGGRGVALPPSGGITLRLIESVTRTDRTSIQSPLQPRIYIGTISTYIHSVPKCQGKLTSSFIPLSIDRWDIGSIVQ